MSWTPSAAELGRGAQPVADDGLRARADARAARRARRPAAALSRRPRRRYERQVDATRTIEERCSRTRGSRSARPSRRTCASWSERIRVGGDEADFEPRSRACGRRPSGSARPSSRRSPRRRWRSSRRPASPSPSSRRVSAGGSTPRTCSTRASCCSRTCRSSTRRYWARRARQIAREKLAVVAAGRDRRARRAGVGGARARARRGRGRRRRRGNLALATAAAEAFLGAADRRGAVDVRCPGRLERRARPPRSGTGRTTSPASATSCRGSRPRTTSIVGSILADKDVEVMLAALSVLGRRARRHRVLKSTRRCPQRNSPARAEPYFSHVETDRRSGRGAARRAREPRRRRCSSRARSISSPTSSATGLEPHSAYGERLSVFAFAAFVLAAIVGGAFAVG